MQNSSDNLLSGDRSVKIMIYKAAIGLMDQAVSIQLSPKHIPTFDSASHNIPQAGRMRLPVAALYPKLCKF